MVVVSHASAPSPDDQACDCQCGRMFVLPGQRAAAAKHAQQTGHHLRGRTAAICSVCAAPAEYECESAPTTCGVHKSSCCRRIDPNHRAPGRDADGEPGNVSE